MPSRELPCPLFDADNHLYETEEALTKYLPKKYASAIQYVQVKGYSDFPRTASGKIQKFILRQAVTRW